MAKNYFNAYNVINRMPNINTTRSPNWFEADDDSYSDPLNELMLAGGGGGGVGAKAGARSIGAGTVAKGVLGGTALAGTLAIGANALQNRSLANRSLLTGRGGVGRTYTNQDITDFSQMMSAGILPNYIQQSSVLFPNLNIPMPKTVDNTTTTGEKKPVPGVIPDAAPVEIPDTTTIPGVIPDNTTVDTTGTRTGTGEEALEFLERSTTGNNNNNQQKKDEDNKPEETKKQGLGKKFGDAARKLVGPVVGGGIALAGMTDTFNMGEQDVINPEGVSGLFEGGNGFTEMTPEDMSALRTQEILEGLQNQQISATQSYSDLYARAMQSAFRRSNAMSDPFTGVSGGQRQQGREALSAAEIAQMGAIGSDFNQVLRDIEMARIAAPAEGRQAAFEQEERRQQQNERAVQRTIRVIDMLNDPQITQEQMTMFLQAEGLSNEKIREILKIREESKGQTDWNKILRNLGLTAAILTPFGWKFGLVSAISAGGVAGFGQTVQGEDWFKTFTENWPNWLKEGLFGTGEFGD